MKKFMIFISVVLPLVFVIWAGVFYYNNLRGVGPAISEPPEDIAVLIDQAGANNTEFPLDVPDGFGVSVFARDLPKARVMVFDPLGNVLVSQTRENDITFLKVEGGEVVSRKDAVPHVSLNHPHGMLLNCNEGERPCELLVAEEGRIRSFEYYPETGNTRPGEVLVELPNGGGHRNHFTRTLHRAPDGTILVSIGSSCNVCVEEDDRRGTIQALTQSESGEWGLQVYATGLRNAVFLANDAWGQVWVTEMGRDELGDDLPPDEINILEDRQLDSNDLPGNYGWPFCYGENIRDDDFVFKNGFKIDCGAGQSSHIDLQAHVAPLGLEFIPDGIGWPEEYHGDLLVAYHGSWNRSEPVGYKIARFSIGEFGIVLDENEQDFIAGWLTDDSKALGRPVDLEFHDGSLYISDDHAGVIYKVSYVGS